MPAVVVHEFYIFLFVTRNRPIIDLLDGYSDFYETMEVFTASLSSF